MAACALLRRHAAVTAIGTEVTKVATHKEDDLVLAAAVSAQADYLVTGDSQLQKLENFGGVAIVSPRRFLDILRQHGSEPRAGSGLN